MAFSLRDFLRWCQGGEKKERSVFGSDKEAYDFCREAYKKSGGLPPELLKAYEFYQKHYDDECDRAGSRTP